MCFLYFISGARDEQDAARILRGDLDEKYDHEGHSYSILNNRSYRQQNIVRYDEYNDVITYFNKNELNTIFSIATGIQSIGTFFGWETTSVHDLIFNVFPIFQIF